MMSIEQRFARTGIVAVEHDVFRFVIKTILETEFGFSRVSTAHSLDEIRLAGADADGTLLLIDAGDPNLGEAAHVTAAREVCPTARLVACGPARRASVFLALHAGAHGYISEAMSIQDLIQAISTVLAGQIFVPAFVADLAPRNQTSASVTRERAPNNIEASLGERPPIGPKLTPRQRDVLRLIMQGLSNKEIANALKLHESTVKVHLAAIFQTLGVRSRSGAAGIGTLFLGQPSGLRLLDADPSTHRSRPAPVTFGE